MIVVFLNLDEVIRIIRGGRREGQLMKAFKLTESRRTTCSTRGCAACARLEEMELRKEHEELTNEKGEVEKLISDESCSGRRSPGRSAGEEEIPAD